MDFSYRFPAVRGIQANKEYYIAMVPLKHLNKLFENDEEYIPPEYRAQRRLNSARIPVIKDYILENRESYAFSALAACVDGEYVFHPTSDQTLEIGILEVSMDARFMIVDGQHRKASISEAIEEDDSLKDESISIVFYEDKGLEHSQQLFTDLNKHAVKTSNSIAELYDSRDELAVITRNVIGSIPFLNEFTDKEKDILGKYSSKFFTLNTFYKANKRIIKHTKLTEETELFLKEYWSAVVENIIPWQEVTNKELSKVDLREQFVVTQAIIIQALGELGNHYYTSNPNDIAASLAGLKKIDWQRNSKIWCGRIVRPNGKIINNNDAARLACNAIKKELKISLLPDEKKLEKEFVKGK